MDPRPITEDEFYDLVERQETKGDLTSEERRAVNERMDMRLCCDGHMCGCYGSTYRDQYEHFLKQRDPDAYRQYVGNGRVI